MSALILGLSTLVLTSVSALLGGPCRLRRRSVRLLIGLQTHFAFADRRPNPSRLSSTAGSSRVSISLATKGFLFARSRQKSVATIMDTADIGRKTQVASDGLTKSALIIAYAFRVEMALLCVGYRCWSGRLSAIDLSIGRGPSDRWYGWES
jgi:hypothetical protein